jgi:hypothetical protein
MGAGEVVRYVTNNPSSWKPPGARLFRLAPEIEIIHPAELRATMIETIRALSRICKSSPRVDN